MHYNKLNLVVLALCLGANSFGQYGVHNWTNASAYTPATDHQEANFTFPQWDAVRDTDLVSVSESHPWDPPINIATASSHFNQPFFNDATMRATSFVISDYSGTGGTLGYSADTHFSMLERLRVDTGNWANPNVSLKLIVPMHGLLAGRGDTFHGQTGYASATMSTSAKRNNILVDQVSGSVDLTATDYNVFTTNATGIWAGRTSQVNVDLPTGNQPRSSMGVELSSFDIMDLGILMPHQTYFFDIDYSFDTTAMIGSPSGSFALADFSRTGHVTFRAEDDLGNEITDYTINPDFDPVPEPASLFAVGLGVVALLRRRRR